MTKKLFILIASSYLTACSMVTSFENPMQDVPQNWRASPIAEVAEMKREADWWKQFQSSELNALIPAAITQNHDLRASLARIEQLRAGVKIAGSELLPSIDAGASANRSDGSDTTSTDRYRGSANIAYEIDLFGRNRALRDSARASLESGKFDRDTLELIVISEVSTRYFEALTLQERLSIARQNLERAESILGIINAQYKEGRISGLEVSQQKVELASSRAQVAGFENQLALALNDLAVLMGKAPQQFNITANSLAGIIIPPVELVLPATLIEQRPDIQAAEADLSAANADIGAARAALFPSLSISAEVSALTTGSTATSLAASLLAPIFHGGRLTGAVERSKARQQELVENYQQAVLVAFREVEDALSSLKATSERQAYYLEAAREADEAYRIANERFEAGAIDFQTLLDTQRAQLTASDNFNQSKFALLSASVDLFRALGGGWKPAENNLPMN